MTQKKNSKKWDWLFKDLSGADDKKSEEEMQEIKSDYAVLILLVVLVLLSMLIGAYLIGHMSPYKRTYYDTCFNILIAFDIFLGYYYVQRSRKQFLEKVKKQMYGDKNPQKFWIVKKINKDDETDIKDGVRISSYKINKYVVLILMFALTERMVFLLRNKKVMDILTRESSMWIMAILFILIAAGIYLIEKNKEKKNNNKI